MFFRLTYLCPPLYIIYELMYDVIDDDHKLSRVENGENYKYTHVIHPHLHSYHDGYDRVTLQATHFNYQFNNELHDSFIQTQTKQKHYIQHIATMGYNLMGNTNINRHCIMQMHHKM